VSRLRRIDFVWADRFAAAALVVDQVLESMLAHAVPHRWVTAVVSSLFAAPVAVRRRWPVGAAVGVAAVELIGAPLHAYVFRLPSGSLAFAPILTSYGLGAWLELRRSVFGVTLAGGLLLAATVLADALEPHSGVGGAINAAGALPFEVVIPWVLGRVVRERQRRAEAFAALELQAERERNQQEQAAIAEERAVIGRELQDIIAHSVSVMVVQAGGARRQLTRHPDDARASIVTVERTGRETLAEMRRLLGVLRRDDDPRALSPQPGLEQLSELAATIQGRGLACEVHAEAIGALTPGVDLVAYRVIEAALTSAEDAGAQRAEVIVARLPGSLKIDVSTDAASDGFLDRFAAIRERVALYDGQLDVVTTGGPVIRCRLPTEAAGPA
jgi:signal transduction histidine kinase